MKFGICTPSKKHIISTRATRKWKRQQAIKAIIPVYGRKGVGWVGSPKKAAYNKVYKRTTFSLWTSSSSSIGTSIGFVASGL